MRVWFEGLAMIEKFVLIIGAMKSGTSSLFWYLSEHPRIAPCSDKEPDYFAEIDGEPDAEAYEAHWNWNPARHRWALEASTSSTKRPAYPDVAERVARLDRGFKFVYCLRDPCDRIVSHRAHNLLNGRWSQLRPLERTPHLVETSRYASQLDEYREWFDDEQILLVKFERMIDVPRETVERVFDFLGLDSDLSLERVGKVHNPTSGDYRDRWFSTVLKNLGGLDEAAIREMSPPLRATYRALLQRQIPSPGLTDEEREWVEFSLSCDVARLEDEYGFDTGGWSIHG